MRNLFPLLVCSTLVSAGPGYAQHGMMGAVCDDDIARYCPDISHIGGAVQLCLGEHMPLMSSECRSAMESAGPGNGRFGWGGQYNRPNYMGLRQIVATIRSLGYTEIHEIDFEGGHYEVEATNAEGVRMELYVDAVTGKILRASREES